MTRGQPTKLSQVGSLPVNCTRVGSSGWLTTLTHNLWTDWFGPRSGLEVTVRNDCYHYLCSWRLPISHQWISATNWNSDDPKFMLATVPGYTAAVQVQLIWRPRFGSRSLQKPDLLCLGGLLPRLDINQHFSVGLEPDHSSDIAVSTTFAAIKYFNYECIITWSVCRLCSSSSYFSSRFEIYDLTDICWVVVKSGKVLGKIRRFLITTERILVRSHIWNRHVKEQLELYNLHTGHVTIWSELVLATVPVLDPAGTIGLRGNGLTPSKIDDFLSEPSL